MEHIKSMPQSSITKLTKTLAKKIRSIFEPEEVEVLFPDDRNQSFYEVILKGKKN